MSDEQLESTVKHATQQFAVSIKAGSPDAKVFSLLVTATETIPLANLDYWESLFRWTFVQEMRNAQDSFWSRLKKPPTFLTWLDICSNDGYTREKFLRSVAGGAPNRFFFALALRRLNDWVPQVRQAARDNLCKIASMSSAEDIAEAVFVTLKHWESWGRLGDEDRRVLSDIMSLPTVTALLKQRLLSATSGPMARILTQMGSSSIMDRDLAEIAASAIQPTLRAKAYKCLLAGEITWVAGWQWVWTNKAYGERKLMPIIRRRPINEACVYQEVLIAAARDRSPLVRKVAGEMLIREPEKAGDCYLPLANALATDPSRSVSEQGKFMLRRLGESTRVQTI